jgi:hypothetical protein
VTYRPSVRQAACVYSLIRPPRTGFRRICCPAWPGPPRRRVDSGLLQDLPHRRRRDGHSQAGQLPVDPAVAPLGVLPGQPDGQGLDVPAGGRPVLPRADRTAPAPDDVAVPAHDRVRGDQEPQPVAAAFGITPSRTTSRARSAQFSFGQRGCRRCRTASWWRRIKISAVCHVSSRRDSCSHTASRVIRRNTNRRAHDR